MTEARRSTPYAALLAALLMLVFFALPVAYLVAMSFAQHSQTEGVDWTLSLANYRELATDSFFWEVAWRTLRLSLLTTLLCLLLAFPVSYYLVSARGWRQLLVFIILLTPLVTSVTVMSYGWLILLGRQGLVNSVLVGIGILSDPAPLMHNEPAIVVGLVHIFVVFMVIAIAGSLHGINPALSLAARSLGAGPVSVFLRVTLPLCLPGIRAGALLVFALSMSAYAIPGVLGGPRYKFISTLVYQQSVSLFNWPAGAALAVLLLVMTALVLTFAYILGTFGRLRRGVVQ
ncbi:ABC transporter permease [Acuticoccus sediminis]|uniref:ABC transporter permease n=1 Tax=Acuticoccus sediminis TaxID=2184697 RepID=A0A8B2NYW2_9HYPH|nr:ABC transporter permease [Acuticoccus sediminis]RAI01770.1 ABC transporter permease [Acuticoccus sediminis]